MAGTAAVVPNELLFRSSSRITDAECGGSLLATTVRVRHAGFYGAVAEPLGKTVVASLGNVEVAHPCRVGSSSCPHRGYHPNATAQTMDQESHFGRYGVDGVDYKVRVRPESVPPHSPA